MRFSLALFTAAFILQPGFAPLAVAQRTLPFPDGAVGVAALAVTSSDGSERLIVGLNPSDSSFVMAAVCIELDTAGHSADWKDCGTGLPPSISVNGLWEDTTGAGAGRIYMTTSGGAGLYFSKNKGESWTPDSGRTLSWRNVYSIAEDAADGILYVATNHGLVYRRTELNREWQQVASVPGIAADTPFSLVADPDLPRTLYAGTFGYGVFKSHDSGLTWVQTEPVALDLPGASHIHDLAFAPEGAPRQLYVATGRGIWRTADGGASWSEIDPWQRSIGGVGQAPEVRSLSWGGDITGDGEPDLYGSTWGNGVLVSPRPITGGSGSVGTLPPRNDRVSFVTPGHQGLIYVGTPYGKLLVIDPAAEDVTFSTGESRWEGVPPTSVELEQNYPNPFNSTTTFEFAVPTARQVRVSVFDLLGREVAVFHDGLVLAGRHRIRFESSALPSGTYIYRLTSAAETMVRTMVLLN